MIWYDMIWYDMIWFTLVNLFPNFSVSLSCRRGNKVSSKLTLYWFNFEKHHQARLQRLKNHGYESGSFSRAFYGWASVAGFSQRRKTRRILDLFFLKVCKSVRVIVAFNASLRSVWLVLGNSIRFKNWLAVGFVERTSNENTQYQPGKNWLAG